MYKTSLKNYMYGALFLGLGVLIPQIFHMTGIGGPVFLPMHIPVILAGMLVCPMIGLYVGIFAPIISFLLTGMPPISPPIMPMMVIELGAYGFVSGFLYKILKKNIYISLVLSMIIGRIALGMAAFVSMQFFGFKISPIFYVKGAIVTGLPGIITQLILVPTLVVMVQKGAAYGGLRNSKETAQRK